MKGPEKVIRMPKTEKVVRSCHKHGKYDAIKCDTPDGKKVVSQCPECEYEELQRERFDRYTEYEQRQAQQKILSVFQESAMPKIFSKVSFDDYKSQGESSDEIKTRLKKYAENFKAIADNGACALLIGSTGTGKTMLAAAVGNYIMHRGYTCFYTKCPRAISRIKRTWKPGVLDTQEDEINRYRKPDLLILDEIPKGCNSKNDWELIHDILDRRTEDRMPTISISTMDEEKLRDKIGGEVFRRLHHKGAILKFLWEPYEGDHVF